MPGLGHRPQPPQAEGMAQRQGHDLQVVAASSHEGIDVQRGLGDVRVREQHALLAARRAGGVDQVGRIL